MTASPVCVVTKVTVPGMHVWHISAPTCTFKSGDSKCHPECMTEACGFDGGDCEAVCLFGCVIAHMWDSSPCVGWPMCGVAHVRVESRGFHVRMRHVATNERVLMRRLCAPDTPFQSLLASFCACLGTYAAVYDLLPLHLSLCHSLDKFRNLRCLLQRDE